MKNNYQKFLLSKVEVISDIENIGYIYSDYSFFDKKLQLLRYSEHKMESLCSEKYGEFYVSPFQKLFTESSDSEYIYTTFTKEKHPIETCGIYLTEAQQEQLIQIKLI